MSYRYENRILFRDHFDLQDDNLYYKRLGELWAEFGNYGKRTTPAGHYFIQEIIEHNFVDWRSWHKKMHPDLVEIIKKEFPQLMCTFKKYQQ